MKTSHTPRLDETFVVRKPDRRQRDRLPAGFLERRQREYAPTDPAEVARRAFELFCEHGCQHGRDLDHWLQAEREVLRASHPVNAPISTR